LDRINKTNNNNNDSYDMNGHDDDNNIEATIDDVENQTKKNMSDELLRETTEDDNLIRLLQDITIDRTSIYQSTTNVSPSKTNDPTAASTPTTTTILNMFETIPIPRQYELGLLGISIIWLCVIAIISFTSRYWNHRTNELIVGFTVNLNLVFFYGAPLSTIFTVLSTYESSSIHIPTMLLNTINGTFWCIYGIAVKDWFIAIPNGVGTLLGIVQILLCCFFPRQNNNKNTNNNETIQTNQQQEQQESPTDHKQS
jgi:Sugar efflux transporter for intercellular exchange